MCPRTLSACGRGRGSLVCLTPEPALMTSVPDCILEGPCPCHWSRGLGQGHELSRSRHQCGAWRASGSSWHSPDTLPRWQVPQLHILLLILKRAPLVCTYRKLSLLPLIPLPETEDPHKQPVLSLEVTDRPGPPLPSRGLDLCPLEALASAPPRQAATWQLIIMMTGSRRQAWQPKPIK